MKRAFTFALPSDTPSLPPTKAEEAIERAVMELARELIGEPLTVRQKRKVENLTIKLVCKCGQRFPIGYMHKCLYCEEWLCETCGEEHFGETREAYKQRTRGQQCATHTK